MILQEIIEHKKQEVEERKRAVGIEVLMEQAYAAQVRDFARALRAGETISLIAEIKRASPSAGIIEEDFEPVSIALQYEKGGARAISCLTDEHFFGGKLEYIRLVKEQVGLPVLRKDFIIDEYQIYESAAYGADALLLIVAALSPAQLEDFLSLTKELGLSALVEVHNEEELKVALHTQAEIIGINNRDLKTFHVDLATTKSLAPLIDSTKIVVAESGIKTREDVEEIAGFVDAVLVGESLMRAEARAEAVRQLATVRRQRQ